MALVLWQPPDGTEESVHISEVSLFRGLNCMQELFSGKEKVSSLEKCPHMPSIIPMYKFLWTYEGSGHIYARGCMAKGF